MSSLIWGCVIGAILGVIIMLIRMCCRLRREIAELRYRYVPVAEPMFPLQTYTVRKQGPIATGDWIYVTPMDEASQPVGRAATACRAKDGDTIPVEM